MIKDDLHLPPMSKTTVVHLELRISPRIFEKSRKGPKNGILGGLGETDSWHCLFKCSRQHKRARSNHGPLLPGFCSRLWELSTSFSNICRKKTAGQVLVLNNFCCHKIVKKGAQCCLVTKRTINLLKPTAAPANFYWQLSKINFWC